MKPSFTILQPDALNSAESLAAVEAIMRGQKLMGEDRPLIWLAGVAFDGVDFRVAELDGFRAYQSTFRNCNFHSVFMHGAYFNECSFENCDFSGMGFGKGVFHNCSLVNLAFDGANAKRSEWSENTIRNLSFARTDFRRAVFWEMDFREMPLSRAVLDETRFVNCQLSAADSVLPGIEVKIRS